MALIRLTSLLLALAFAGSVVVGLPLHSGAESCGMDNTAMDCCQLAHAGTNERVAIEARLCCALNCSEPAPTPTAGYRRLPPPSTIPLHPAVVSALSDSLIPRAPAFTAESPPSPPRHPAYIRHLALLI